MKKLFITLAFMLSISTMFSQTNTQEVNTKLELLKSWQHVEIPEVDISNAQTQSEMILSYDNQSEYKIFSYENIIGFFTFDNMIMVLCLSGLYTIAYIVLLKIFN